MIDQQNPQVLIVGAGPTGLMLACELAKYAVPFLIIDEKDGPVSESRAFGLQPRTLEIFEQIEIIDECLEKGKRLDKMHLYVSENENFYLRFSQVKSRFPFVLMISQEEIEKILLKKLQSFGLDVQWNTHFIGLNDSADSIDVVYGDHEGNHYRQNVNFVVGCDGAHSNVRKLSGIDFKGSSDENLWLLADCVTDWERSVNEARVYLSEKGVSAFIPLSDEYGRFMFELMPGVQPVRLSDPEQLLSLARARKLPVTKVRNMRWLSHFRFHYKLATNYRKGHVFLAGDSAHIHSPVGAQGLNTGVQDAFNLAWKFAYFLNGLMGEEVLDSYEKERKSVAKNVVRTTSLITKLMRAKNPVSSFLKKFTFSKMVEYPALRERLVNTLAQVNVNYESSDLSETYWLNKEEGSYQVKAGDRLVNYTLKSIKEEESIGISELINDAKFSLFLVVGKPGVEQDYYEIYSFYRNVLINYSKYVRVHLIFPEELSLYKKDIDFSAFVDEKNKMHEAFSIQKNALILVRPDGYIAFKCTPLSPKIFDEYMHTLFLEKGSEFKRYA